MPSRPVPTRQTANPRRDMKMSCASRRAPLTELVASFERDEGRNGGPRPGPNERTWGSRPAPPPRWLPAPPFASFFHPRSRGFTCRPLTLLYGPRHSWSEWGWSARMNFTLLPRTVVRVASPLQRKRTSVTSHLTRAGGAVWAGSSRPRAGGRHVAWFRRLVLNATGSPHPDPPTHHLSAVPVSRGGLQIMAIRQLPAITARHIRKETT